MFFSRTASSILAPLLLLQVLFSSFTNPQYQAPYLSKKVPFFVVQVSGLSRMQKPPYLQILMYEEERRRRERRESRVGLPSSSLKATPLPTL